MIGKGVKITAKVSQCPDLDKVLKAAQTLGQKVPVIYSMDGESTYVGLCYIIPKINMEYDSMGPVYELEIQGPTEGYIGDKYIASSKEEYERKDK